MGVAFLKAALFTLNLGIPAGTPGIDEGESGPGNIGYFFVRSGALFFFGVVVLVAPILLAIRRAIIRRASVATDLVESEAETPSPAPPMAAATRAAGILGNRQRSDLRAVAFGLAGISLAIAASCFGLWAIGSYNTYMPFMIALLTTLAAISATFSGIVGVGVARTWLGAIAPTVAVIFGLLAMLVALFFTGLMLLSWFMAP